MLIAHECRKQKSYRLNRPLEITLEDWALRGRTGTSTCNLIPWYLHNVTEILLQLLCSGTSTLTEYKLFAPNKRTINGNLTDLDLTHWYVIHCSVHFMFNSFLTCN